MAGAGDCLGGQHGVALVLLGHCASALEPRVAWSEVLAGAGHGPAEPCGGPLMRPRLALGDDFLEQTPTELRQIVQADCYGSYTFIEVLLAAQFTNWAAFPSLNVRRAHRHRPRV